MPTKIMMTLSNGNYSHKSVTAYTNYIQSKTASAQVKPTSLTSSMIGRIHLAKPGCGSCGK
jgi:TctA family transporter